MKPDVINSVLCSGGVDHINVQPDESAWRCILERQLGINVLGNVFDPEFEPLTGQRQVRRITQPVAIAHAASGTISCASTGNLALSS